jgi:hypothetical protein
MLGVFDVGDKPTFVFKVNDPNGTLADPTTVKVLTRNPAGTETTYVYSVATEIVKTAIGTYEFTIPQFTSTQVGGWSIRCNGSGGVTSSTEDTFIVRETAYTTPLP